MTPKDVIKNTMDTCHQVLAAYLGDLSDAELMVRPVPEANHIAWQLGHLIGAEQKMITDAGYGMPDLPAGFAEAHTPETASSDDPARFHTKEQYLSWMEEQRAGTLAALAALPEAELDKASPEPMREWAPTLGVVFNMIGIHEMMHAGQFAVVRRKLDKAMLF